MIRFGSMSIAPAPAVLYGLLLARLLWWSPRQSLTRRFRACKPGTNTRHHSRVINEGLGMNFNKFINLERVRAAQVELGRAGDECKLPQIALGVGCRSSASFKRAFKSCASVTRSAWPLSACTARRIA